MASLLGGAYDSSDDEAITAKPTPTQPKAVVNAAPDVSTEVWSTLFEV